MLMTLWISLLVAGMTLAGMDAARAATVGMIEIRGIIGPATSGYIARSIRLADKQGDACLIVQLDTPGGLLDSTKEIVQTFYASPIPIVVYVAPSGANAGSAGTFITLAADIAAMAPNTSIGAAHPVELGTGGGGSGGDVMRQKLENFASSYIEAIARKRGRNADWAVSAVRESASITAEKALELNVINLIAVDVPGLLRQIDGREINGRPLKTAGARVVLIPMAAREKFFQILSRPEVMFFLMLIALYGIIGEISNPGTILPGVAGAIALVLFLYMSTILPLNVAGAAAIVLAVVFFIIDAYSPTHGILTVGGIVAFFLGALMLFNSSEPAFHLSLVYIIPATLLTALFFLIIVSAGLRARRLPVRVGRETLPGQIVRALTRIDASGGKVFLEGEYWNAVSDMPVDQGQPVEIIGVNGLTLKVKSKT